MRDDAFMTNYWANFPADRLVTARRQFVSEVLRPFEPMLPPIERVVGRLARRFLAR